MSTTVLDIYNAALSLARGRGRLNSLSDDSIEREECDIWYSFVVDTVQEGAFWPTCRTTARLELQATRGDSTSWMNGDPEAQYRYSYRLPSNYLRAWYLPNYEHFTLSYSEPYNVLNTNAANAVLIYARREENPARWSPSQRMATVHGLAAYIVGSLKGENDLRDRLVAEADAILRQAQATALNSMNLKVEHIPPQLAARGYAESQTTQYFYPVRESFGAAIVNA